MKSILLTGGTGFVGSRLLAKLCTDPKCLTICVSRRFVDISHGCELVVKSVTAQTDWSAVLQKDQVVIHAAGRAHVSENDLADSLAGFRDINVDATLNLARQAAEVGVQRFIFISSIGVNGDVNCEPFTEDNVAQPTGSYALSKWEAEQGLWEVHRSTGLDIVIIRPPLVYGPDAPGNFGRLVSWVSKGIPLPLGVVKNKRSLVAVDNLIDLVITCIRHPAAANQVFLAGDGEDLSTTELLRGVGKAMGKPARLIPVPAGLLMAGATILGKKAMAQRLLGSLQVDISKARNMLDWIPPLSVDEGLKRCFEFQDDLK